MSKNYNQTLQTNNSSLEDIIEQLNNMPDAGGAAEPTLQDKTVTPTTSKQIITADSGYDGLDTVTVNAMPTATQATPNITVNTSGLITATATQTAGYVAAGTKSATKQLAFQAAQTITPGTTNKTIAAGTYIGGTQTIKGDANLVAANIVSGKTIFGVAGTATAGDDPFAPTTPFTYTVNAISGAQYGFAKNSNGYYESQNKGQNNSYAICRVNLTVTTACDIVFDVINYAESSFDYALFSDLNKTLSLSSTADSSNVKKNFKGQQSASVVNVTYSDVTAGTYFIDIKFIKDYSGNNNNDSVQFKLQEQEGGLSQETINKILAADNDLVAENIKSGVNIFGINGTYVGSGGSSGGTDAEDAFVTRTLTNYTNDRVITIGSSAFANWPSLTSVSFPNATSIGDNAFADCFSLTSVSFPKVTTIGNYAFEYCSKLTSINFPNATTIGNNAFRSCTKLTSISFPNVTTIGSSAFYSCFNLTSVSFPKVTTINNYGFTYCSKLTTVSFPKVTTIGSYAFFYCSSLASIYLGALTVCTLSNEYVFSKTGITSTTGSIFVPASLLASYKAATNWAFFSNRIFSYTF